MSEGASRESGVASREDCKHLNLIVLHSWRSGHIIKRRRRCLDCLVEWTSPETIAPPPLHRANADNLRCHVKNG